MREHTFAAKLSGMATTEEIAWAAGLFDGEGSITNSDRDIQLLLKNTDLELVHRFDQVVGRGHVYGPYTHRPNDGYPRKPYWMWVAQGDAAHDVVDLLGPWLSQRRCEQARIRGVLVTGWRGRQDSADSRT